MHRLGTRPGSLVGALADERVEHVGDGDDPPRHRDRLAEQTGRVARAVPALVVVERHLGRELDERGGAAGQDLGADRGVGLHHLELGGRERAGLQQDGVGDSDLADVVQTAGQAELLAELDRLAELAGEQRRHVAHSDGVLAGVGVAELGDHRQTLERLELVLLEVVGAAADQLLELAGAQAQDLGLLPGRLGVVGDLQRLHPQVGAVAEQVLVPVEARLLVGERLFEPTELLVDRRQRGVGAQLLVDHAVLEGEREGLPVLLGRSTGALGHAVEVAACEGQGAVRRRSLCCAEAVEGDQLGLRQAGSGLLGGVHRAVRRRQLGQDARHRGGLVTTGDLEGGLAGVDGEQVLAARRSRPGQAGQRPDVEVVAARARIGGHGCVVGGDGAIEVAEGLVDVGHGGEQWPLARPDAGDAVPFERLQRCVERVGEVAGLHVDPGEQVHRLDLDGRRAAAHGELARLEGCGECCIDTASPLGQHRLAQHGLGLGAGVDGRTSQHPCLLCHRLGCVRVDVGAGLDPGQQLASGGECDAPSCGGVVAHLPGGGPGRLVVLGGECIVGRDHRAAVVCRTTRIGHLHRHRAPPLTTVLADRPLHGEIDMDRQEIRRGGRRMRRRLANPSPVVGDHPRATPHGGWASPTAAVSWAR